MNRAGQLLKREAIRRASASRRGISATSNGNNFIKRGRIAQVKKQEQEVQNKVQDFFNNLTIENFTSRYNNLPSNVRAIVDQQPEIGGIKAQAGEYEKQKKYQEEYEIGQSVARRGGSRYYLRSQAARKGWDSVIAGYGAYNKSRADLEAAKKEYVKSLKESLPFGDKVVLDKKGNPIGIESKSLGQTVELNKSGIDYYTKKIANMPNVWTRTDLKKALPAKEFLDAKVKELQAAKSGSLNKNIISESLYKDLKLKATLGDASSEKILNKVGGFIPQKDIQRSIAEYNLLSSRISRGITSFAVKGDKLGSNYKNMVFDSLKKRGVSFDIKNVRLNNFLTKTKRELDKYGLSTKDFEAYSSWMDKRINKLYNDAINLSAKRRERINKITSIIKEGENLSDRELLKLIKKRLGSDWKDAIRATKDIGERIGLIIARTAVNFGIATPRLIKQFKSAPLQTLVSLPPAIFSGLSNDFKTVKSGDPLKIADLATEYWTLGKIFNTLGRAGKITLNAVRKLSPKTVRLANGRIVLRKAPKERFTVRGKQRLLAERVQRPSIKRPFSSVSDFLKGRKPGQFKRFTKDPGLVLKEQTVSSGATPFAKQFKMYGGKEITAVNAAKDQLTSWIRRKSLVRKPLMGTNSFLDDYALIVKKDPVNGRSVANILKKFDTGKSLTIKEFVKVNKWLQKNVAPNITLLERSLYLDPAGGVRLSRLGAEESRRANIFDLITGNFKFRENRPQILVFEKAKVARVPKYIQKIVNKIEKRGVNYRGFDTDLARLVKWQTRGGTGLMRPGGSPIYMGGVELEVTLAPGEYIKRIKKLGSLYKKGKKIDIVSAEVYAPPKNILSLIKKAQNGKLTDKALTKLEKLLSKKLGRRIRIDVPSAKIQRKLFLERRRIGRRLDQNVPILRFDGRGLRFVRIGRKITPKTRRISRSTRKIKRVKRIGRISRPIRATKPRKSARPRKIKRTTKKDLRGIKRVTRPTKRVRPIRPRRETRGRRVPPSIKKKPIVRPNEAFRKTILSSATRGYFVVMKVGNRKVKLNPRPLSISDAKDYLAYRVDNGLSRTAWFEPVGKTKKIFRVPKNMKGYYSKIKYKLRPYKIRVGRKRRLVNGFIEKRKYILDTSGEKRSIKLAGVGRKTVKRKRKITKNQRKVLLARLKKARMVRMRNLRRKKR